MLKTFLVAIGWMISLFVFGQTDNDPMYVNYSFFPRRDMQEAVGSAVYSQLEANAILPGIKIGSKAKIYTNLNYKSSYYSFEDTAENEYTKQLDDVRLGFIAMYDFAENWQMILAPRLNFRTGLDDKFTKRDIFPSVHLLGVRTSKNNPNLAYGLGISYNNEATKNMVTPLAIFQYRNDKMRIYTIIPSFLYFLMTPSPKFEYGISANIEATQYHVEHYLPSHNYLRIQNLTIAPTIGYQLYTNLWLNLKAGYALPGKYQLLDADFDPIPGMKENKFDGGLYFSGGISLRVKEKVKEN